MHEREIMQQDLIGTVLNTEGNQILIGIQDEAQCQSCGLHGVCQDKQLSILKTEVSLALNKGEQVSVSYNKILRSSAWLYLMPIFAFFAGIFLADFLIPVKSEFWLFAGGAFGLSLSLIILRSSASYFKENDYKIHLTKIT